MDKGRCFIEFWGLCLFLKMNHTFSQLIGDHRSLLVPVVDFVPASDILLPLDFTQANKELTEEILQDTARFSSYIDGLLDRAGAKYGIGGYDEHRTVYSRSTVFDAGNPGEEPRRLHLGIDIWGGRYRRHGSPRWRSA